MRQRAVEKHYSITETAFLLGFSTGWVRENLARLANFGGVFKVPGRNERNPDYRISATAINGFLDAHRVQSVEEALEMAGVYARSEKELNRVLRTKSGGHL